MSVVPKDLSCSVQKRENDKGTAMDPRHGAVQRKKKKDARGSELDVRPVGRDAQKLGGPGVGWKATVRLMSSWGPEDRAAVRSVLEESRIEVLRSEI